MAEGGYVYYRERYERVFVEAQGALSDCRMRTDAADSAAGSISATTGISALSWGERVNVAVGATPQGVYVSANSSAKVNDIGKGNENLRRFFEALDRRLPGARIGFPAGNRWGQAYGYQPNLAAWPNYTPLGQPTPPGMMGAVAAATFNGIVALFLGFSMVGTPGIGTELGACMSFAALMLILGAALIGAKSYKAGAVLCFIGGLITIPLGLLGTWAGSKAMATAKWRKDNPSAPA
jgi:hypothetical protein